MPGMNPQNPDRHPWPQETTDDGSRPRGSNTTPTYVAVPGLTATPDRWAKSAEALTEAMNNRTESSDRPTVVAQLRGLEYDLQQAHEAFTDLRRHLAPVMPETDSPVPPRAIESPGTNREPSDLMLHTIGLRNQAQNLIERIRTAIMDTDL